MSEKIEVKNCITYRIPDGKGTICFSLSECKEALKELRKKTKYFVTGYKECILIVDGKQTHGSIPRDKHTIEYECMFI